MTTQDVERSPADCRTRFSACGRLPALGILVLTAVATGWCLWVALTQEIMPPTPEAGSRQTGSAAGAEVRGDTDFYRDIVRRVRAGDNYYDAVAEELRQRGYAPHSTFNWRTPLYAWLFGKLPGPIWGQLLLGIGALTTIFLACRALCLAGGEGRAVVALVLFLGPFAWCGMPGVCLFTELWAGMLIALSVSAYALGRWRLAVVTGLLALFFRELALPYCVICLGLACWQRRRAEVAWWLAGLALYGCFMTLHATAAARRITATDVLHATGWVQFGGTAFVLLTTQINYFLIVAPSWVAALYLPLSLLGLAAWRGTNGVRAGLTATAFVAAFTVIGIKPHNAYWGFMYAPLLPLGLVWAPAALRDLWSAVVQPLRRERVPPFLARLERGAGKTTVA
jgi:hypothetical protein